MAASRTRKPTGKEQNVDLTKFQRWFNRAQESRREIDWRWFSYDLWVNGDHYARFDRETEQIVTTTRDVGRPKVVINKTYQTLRAVRNFAMRNRPRAEVTPFDLSEDQIEQARMLNKYLAFLHEKLHMRTKLRAAVWNALKYSVGYWQVLWDENADEGKGEVNVELVDTYDLYWDEIARKPEEARYVILATRRNIEDLLVDPKYNTEQVEGLKTDDSLAASHLKSRLIQVDRGALFATNRKVAKDEDEGSVIVKEVWFREKKKKSDDTVIKVAAFAGDRLIRPPETTDLEQFPFFMHKSDVEPLRMYGQGWVKNLIPINKLIDRLESEHDPAWMMQMEADFFHGYQDLVKKAKGDEK